VVVRDSSPILSVEDVRFGFASQPDFLGPIRIAAQRGDCWAIVGPNGAGKSTLLRLMAGLCRPRAGCVRIGGRSLAGLPGRERARRLTFLPQHPPVDLDLSVRDVVLMGRFPHRSFGLFESFEDYRIADRAMAVTATAGLAGRSMATLSGGEAQRVHVAAALAQEPDLVLLDEPTASLDIQHQLAIFKILRDRADRDGLAVVVVTHDVNLAAQFCSQVLLLHEGKAAAIGPPSDVLTPSVLVPVYAVELQTLAAPGHPGHQWVVPSMMSL
jgi:iron complex transport system ATP-binding protein